MYYNLYLFILLAVYFENGSTNHVKNIMINKYFNVVKIKESVSGFSLSGNGNGTGKPGTAGNEGTAGNVSTVDVSNNEKSYGVNSIGFFLSVLKSLSNWYTRSYHGDLFLSCKEFEKVCLCMLYQLLSSSDTQT